MKRRTLLQLLSLAPAAPSLALAAKAPEPITPLISNDAIKDLIYKARKPDEHYPSDIIAEASNIPLMNAAFKRLNRLQRVVGYGNFNVLSFDHALKFASRYSVIGDFPKAELDILDELFHHNASHYGFLGKKPVDKLTSSIRKREILKVPGSGHFLYRGPAQAMFQKVKKEIGDSLVLTSGIRSVTKQMYLFLRKASRHNWNLSLASRSLAPPGYSFHGVGDFDVGTKGLGALNFTDSFSETDEFKRLVDLGYIDIRYPLENPLGVRFEPWHIKII